MRLSLVMAAAVLLFGCGAATVLDSTLTTTVGEMDAEWLILVYMSADNRLESAAIRDLNEMEAADLGGESMVIACLLDRSGIHDTSNDDWSGSRFYRVVQDPDGVDSAICSVPVPGWEPDTESDLADGATLAHFLDFATTRYQAEHLALVLWGESSDFGSMLFDRDSSMSIVAIADAIEAYGIDILAFDTSFSSSIEVAYEVHPLAGFMIASTDAVPEGGWPYDDILTRFAGSDRSPRAFCGAAVAGYRSACRDEANATISAIDLLEIPSVNTALNTLSADLSLQATTASRQARLRSLLFHDVEDYYVTPGYLNIDLTHLTELVGDEFAVPAAAEDLRASINRAVVEAWSHGTGNPNGHGLSVHLVPLDSDGVAAATHDEIYVAGDGSASELAFTSASRWVPVLPAGPGLLYRLFYEVLP